MHIVPKVKRHIVPKDAFGVMLLWQVFEQLILEDDLSKMLSRDPNGLLDMHLNSDNDDDPVRD